MRRFLPLFLPLFLVLSGCILAPPLPAPDPHIPAQWPVGEARSAEISWREAYADPKLLATLDLALAFNLDYQISALNLQKSQAQYGIVKSELWPQFTANLSAPQSQIPASVTTSGNVTRSETVSANLALSAYELDFFGRLRSLNRAALETYLGAEESQKALKLSLRAQVAQAWINVAYDRDVLALAQSTEQTRKSSLTIAEGRAKLGAISLLDLNSARALEAQARGDKAAAISKINVDLIILNQLIGTDMPADLLPKGLDEVHLAHNPPIGLPSDVLLKRPDVMASEHALKAANANIGAARAAFFPRISLTGSTGSSARQLDGLFTADSRTWAFTPQISVPIFRGGANVLGLKTARLNQDIAVAGYEKAIQVAFSETAQTLSIYDQIDERLAAAMEIRSGTEASFGLSKARYDAGVDSYLGLLETERSLYANRLNELNIRYLKYSTLIRLYAVLGLDE
jgi:multidrug efflux system outer membrane protein